VKCKSKGVKGARGKMGILVLTQNEIFFLYTKFFGLFKKIFALDKAQIKAVYLKKRLLADFLEVHYLNSKGKAKICKFIALKNRAPLLKKIESFFKREGEQS
ncbi:MAG: hypothetical protein N2445_06030, partial [Acidobacteria bacterium]|nr:hypothetical protein [Acidobacteriota bacterium]